jgi:hypothetical protein
VEAVRVPWKAVVNILGGKIGVTLGEGLGG